MKEGVKVSEKRTTARKHVRRRIEIIMIDGQEVEAKCCSKCETIKPLTQYYINKVRLTGYQWYCITCNRLVGLERRMKLNPNLKPKLERSKPVPPKAEKPAVPVAPNEVKRCIKCNEDKPLVYFHKTKTGGRMTRCKPCML